MCLSNHEKEEHLLVLKARIVQSEKDLGRKKKEISEMESEPEDKEQLVRQIEAEYARMKAHYQSLVQTYEEMFLGEFDGDCKECGEEIPLERLAARPDARLCVYCKGVQEKEKSRYGFQPGTSHVREAFTG